MSIKVRVRQDTYIVNVANVRIIFVYNIIFVFFF